MASDKVRIHAEADDSFDVMVEGVTPLEVEGISKSLPCSTARKALAVSDLAGSSRVTSSVSLKQVAGMFQQLAATMGMSISGLFPWRHGAKRWPGGLL